MGFERYHQERDVELNGIECTRAGEGFVAGRHILCVVMDRSRQCLADGSKSRERQRGRVLSTRVNEGRSGEHGHKSDQVTGNAKVVQSKR